MVILCVAVWPLIWFTSLSSAEMINPPPLFCVSLHLRSVAETTFDLHGDLHSGSALPTSKVPHLPASFGSVHVFVCAVMDL